jgi:TATA-box binding protein (TBP) (component of TFIID and TFIIIB)
MVTMNPSGYEEKIKNIFRDIYPSLEMSLEIRAFIPTPLNACQYPITQRTAIVYRLIANKSLILYFTSNPKIAIRIH